MLKRGIFAASIALLAIIANGNAQEITHPHFEDYPDDLRAALEIRDSFLRAIPPSAATRMSLEQVITTSKLWKPGSTVTVAVQGGDSALIAAMIDATREWTTAGNLKLDFGFNSTTGAFRQWKSTDTVYTADIRVGFNESGYWSVIGNDSDDPLIAPPSRASLNLQAFNIQRPSDFRAVILHEFGHALGFQHEHQHPLLGCDADFRWEDDPGYIPTRDQFQQFIRDVNGKAPGIYTVLGGPPNGWPRSKVDYNLRQLAESHMFKVMPFDRMSIMKYFFPAWMFVGGTASHCFTSDENILLSDGDKAAMRDAYPINAALLQQTLTERRLDLSTLLQTQIPPPTRAGLQHALTEIQ